MSNETNPTILESVVSDYEQEARSEFTDAKVKPRRPASRSKGKDRSRTETKGSLVLKKLGTTRGASIGQIEELTGWQTHSVRGFLSGVVRKKLGLNLVCETGKDGQRRYRIVEAVSQDV